MGAIIPKGQHSRVPWPGNCRVPLIYKAGLQALQHTHIKHKQQGFGTELMKMELQYTGTFTTIFMTMWTFIVRDHFGIQVAIY